MAAKHGLEGIELFYEDLVDHAGSDSPAALLAGAASVRDLCCSLSLEIVCLQPFMHYEGLLDRQRHAERIEEMKLWMKLAHVLGTDLIQVPSSFLPRDQLSSDIDFIASDLREVAELGLKQTPVIRFAYESLSWGTVVDKWEVCWDIVSQVDRPNFGICLDSFNILGRIYADPTSETGMLACPGAGIAGSFYGETKRGAYLPVKDVTHAIIKQIGFDGWVSMELFNRVMNRTDETVVEELAERAGAAWNKIRCDLALDTATNDRSEHEGGPEHFVREPELARL
ncbi:3-dehydroshikimate dehydratase [Pyrenophora tritici-repentis]|nr:3-dehydroshikimate dehydratase [Pyrenophora tritici-repentis]